MARRFGPAVLPAASATAAEKRLRQRFKKKHSCIRNRHPGAPQSFSIRHTEQFILSSRNKRYFTDPVRIAGSICLQPLFRKRERIEMLLLRIRLCIGIKQHQYHDENEWEYFLCQYSWSFNKPIFFWKMQTDRAYSLRSNPCLHCNLDVAAGWLPWDFFQISITINSAGYVCFMKCSKAPERSIRS